MKRTLSILLILAMAFTLAASVSAQTITPSEEYLTYVNEELDYYSAELQTAMNGFIMSDNPKEILSLLTAEDVAISEYGTSTVPVGEEFYSLFGFVEYYDTENYEGRESAIKTLSADGISIECIVTEIPNSGHYSSNSVIVEKTAFDLLNEDLSEYLENFETAAGIDEYINRSSETLTEWVDDETVDTGYVYWVTRPYIYGIYYDNTFSDGIELHARYGINISDVTCAYGAFSNSPTTIRCVSWYNGQYVGYRFGTSNAVFCDAYYMTLSYAEPENETDRDDYSKYTLESVSFYADSVGSFDGGVYETSPQTGSGAALLTFLAVASLGIACRVKKRAR
ncbi:MAG: hypothetical protein LUD44_02300 [Firmicutes bacterium]|nr:hypothetical protein [Bacillota bacterium]